MSYIPLSQRDIEEMLRRIGVSSLDELFQSIPEEIRWKGSLNLPSPLSESELLEYFEKLGQKNTYPQFLSFLGAGAYPHLIPAVVDYLSSRGEFVTPYTPYQPEVSQGTLQIIFEYQTLICQLTALEIANASLYEGATAVAEAVLMAQRIRNRSKILVARSLHPQYRQVMATYVKNLGLTIEEVDFDLKSGQLSLDDLTKRLSEEVIALVVQNPNFFGVVEKLEEAFSLSHQKGALAIAVIAEGLSLGLLKPPGEVGADIACGEGQSFGLPLAFGGPYLGFIACRENFLRQLPGRIAGQTKDAEGKIGYVLTLSTREQHIRREKATSNICTNQAWCALRATIFLETLGPKGLRELAYYNLQKANYALEKLCSLPGIKRHFSGPIFNEFVLELEQPVNKITSQLLNRGIIAGYPLERDYPELKNCLLLCVTEVHSKEKIDELVRAFKEVLS
ncbi:MAG: aminomethyl-transferring glycine dehydrogenase subunit GcvPA [Candidatus Aminicenantes bacterium]|nr:aminomethyl-transferring glycine dehydrogenase subunit GcvPA [Candidatus Aminicenantes bacterium]